MKPRFGNPLPAIEATREGLGDWLSAGPGEEIAAAECRHADRLVDCLFGYHALQVGLVGEHDLLRASRMPYRGRVVLPGDRVRGTGAMVHGQAAALPIDTDSADLVVLPHVLEFETHPHQALREAHRVLVAEGHLLVFGFNPWSLLGATRWLARSSGQAPWCGRFLNRRRLRDWLELLGFDVLAVGGCFYRPALVSATLLARLRVPERANASLAPLLGGSYLMLARKRVVTLTPARPRWRVQRRLVPVSLPGGAAARTGPGD